MKRRTVSVAVMLLVALGLCAEAPLDLKAWRIDGQVDRYGPDNLWELIDGAADAFLAYGFQELRTFECLKEPLRFMVHIYDMGNPLSAFGMYRSENPPLPDSVPIGAETQFSDYLAVMLCGRHYVKVETIRDKASAENCRSLIEELHGALGGRSDLPAELSLLPGTDMLSKSAAYTRENFLGLAELMNALSAKYRCGETTYRRFVIPNQAAEPFLKSLPSNWRRCELRPAVPLLLCEIPYIGLVGITAYQGLAIGIVDIREEDRLRQILLDWLKAD